MAERSQAANAASRMSNTTYDLVFDRADPVYKPGEEVSGKIVVKNDEEMDGVQKVLCKLRGKVKSAIRADTGEDVHHHKSTILEEELTLLDVAANHGGKLPAGVHELPFKFTLPETGLPPTYSGPSDSYAHLGSVAYYVLGVVEREKKEDAPAAAAAGIMKRLSLAKAEPVKPPLYANFAVSAPDLNKESVPTGEEINKPSEQESNAGGLGGLIGGKPVKTTAQLHNGTAFKYGEKATVSLKADSAAKASFASVTLSLVHHALFFAPVTLTDPEGKQIKKVLQEKKKTILAKAVLDAKAPDGKDKLKKLSEGAEITFDIPIPPATPYNKPGTSTGHFEYFPHKAGKKLAEGEAIYTIRHPPSTELDPNNEWLYQGHIQSYYHVTVAVAIKNGAGQEHKLPITIHPGTTKSGLKVDKDDSDFVMAASAAELP